MAVIGDLKDFAEVCGVSEETMRKYFRTFDEVPVWVITVGTKGRGYEIDCEAGLTWWKGRLEAEELASAERRAQLQQLRFEHLGDAAEAEEALSLSAKQRRDEYAAVMERIKLRQTMGQLVDVGELEGPATSAAIDLRRRLMQVPTDFAAEAGLTPAEVKPLHALLERAIAAFLDALPGAMKVLRQAQDDADA